VDNQSSEKQPEKQPEKQKSRRKGKKAQNYYDRSEDGSYKNENMYRPTFYLRGSVLNALTGEAKRWNTSSSKIMAALLCELFTSEAGKRLLSKSIEQARPLSAQLNRILLKYLENEEDISGD
jgi:hypothetical protein